MRGIFPYENNYGTSQSFFIHAVNNTAFLRIMTKQNSVEKTPKQPEKKFITSMELNSLKIRKSIVDMKKHEAFLLEGEMQMYVSGLLAKYETDNKKRYNISIETGEITEQKSEE